MWVRRRHVDNKSNHFLGVNHKPGLTSALSHLVLKTTLKESTCLSLSFQKRRLRLRSHGSEQ